MLESANADAGTVLVSTSAGKESREEATLDTSNNQLFARVALAAGGNNTVKLTSPVPVESISISRPSATYYPSTSFTLQGNATLTECTTADLCKPVGWKIGNIYPASGCRYTVPSDGQISIAAGSTKYVQVDYINNEVALDTAWDQGSNSRNLTVSVNGGEPARLEVPLSGTHSELFGVAKGWEDSASYGLLVPGWKDGENEIVVGNVDGQLGVQPAGADFVGIRVFN